MFICLCFACPRVGDILRDGSRALLNIRTGCGRSWLVLLSWWERQNAKSSLVSHLLLTKPKLPVKISSESGHRPQRCYDTVKSFR